MWIATVDKRKLGAYSAYPDRTRGIDFSEQVAVGEIRVVRELPNSQSVGMAYHQSTLSRRERLALYEPPTQEDPRSVDGSPERNDLLRQFPQGVAHREWPVGVPDRHGNVVAARAGQ